MNVVISRNHLYVLSRVDNPCMHVLTLTGKKLFSLISCGKDMQLLAPHFFCLDPQHNFIIGDVEMYFIRVFSPVGDLLYTIGGREYLQGSPYGVAITPDGKLVSVAEDKSCGLQIFTTLRDIVY